jgi:hypothetical protein
MISRSRARPTRRCASRWANPSLLVPRHPSLLVPAMGQLILKRASANRLSGEWDAVVGRIMKAAAAPVGAPWLWTLAFGQHEDRSPTHGYTDSREAASCARMARSVKRGLNHDG